MPKIHVLLKKEDLIEEKLKDKIVVVFDILLATTTITTVLEHGATEVIPVMNRAEAVQIADRLDDGTYCLAGEYLGTTIEGFLEPYPQALAKEVRNKTVILSTTNGTVALRSASEAKKLYAASILNSQAVANKIVESFESETILLVCSGSHGSFNLEDFYGVGYFIDCLLKKNTYWEMTDSAHAAHLLFANNRENGYELMLNSRVGKKLAAKGFANEIQFVVSKDIFHHVPIVKDGVCLLELKKGEGVV